jgi:heme exporter protein A
MLEVSNLSCVRGTRRLFNGLSFSAKPGQVLEVRGANGSGKTSLLRIICGLAAPAAGEVQWNGQKIGRLGEDYLSSIVYVAHQTAVKDELTAMENLLVSARLIGSKATRAELSSILARLGLGERMHLAARLLSAGQRRRLALARLLATNATLWILDEAMASLDDAGVTLANRLISEHVANGGMAIMATHQDLSLSAGDLQRIELVN